MTACPAKVYRAGRAGAATASCKSAEAVAKGRVVAPERTLVQAAEAGRAAALASSSNAVEMSRMLMTPIRL